MPGSERPTLAPPYDPSAFARESEAKLRASVPAAEARASSGTVRTAVASSIALASIPLLTVSFVELRTLALDHRAGFLLSLVDGTCTVETILDMCGMPSAQALDILGDLAGQGILSFR